ncbi:MAG: zf-HC2 domain-containing protein [Thermoguttaceae bacterium]|jgi:anti-sigma factor RsiW
MKCDEVKPLLHPHVDKELDLVRHVEIEEHLKGCHECAEQEQNLRSLRVALSAPALYYRAPAALSERLAGLCPGGWGVQPLTGSRRNRLVPVAITAAVSSLAAAAAILLFLVLRDRQSADDRLVASVVNSHIRSLQVEHLKDVVSTDQHTMKPWFRGKLDFSPLVPDFASQGFALTGGRLDYLTDREVAALVYQCRAHVINVFQWPADGKNTAVRSFSRQGYHIRGWQGAGMVYWAISDINDHDLDEFVHLFQEQTQEVRR